MLGLRTIVICFAILATTGCASSRMSDTAIDRDFISGRFDSAIDRLKKGFETHGGDKGKDSILYLLDLGLAHHYAGNNEEAIKIFHRADEVTEIKDYTSIAAEAGTLLVSDNVKSYRAEEFENVLISVYLAICYAELGRTEDALVEARRVNHKLEQLVSKGGRTYRQNAFARYLSAALYESEKEWDHAYLDYKKTRELQGDYLPLGKDLWRTATAMRMQDEAEQWESTYGLTAEEKAETRKLMGKSAQGEIFIIFENGLSPEKVPNPNFHSIPKFRVRYNTTSYATVDIDGQPSGRTEMLHDVESLAIQNLDEKYAKIIAKKIAGAAAKEALAYGVGRATKSEEVWFLTRLVLYLSDQADVRSWKLLPRDFQVHRVAVAPGVHTVRLLPQGHESGKMEKTVQVEAGKKVFVSFRAFP